MKSSEARTLAVVALVLCAGCGPGPATGPSPQRSAGDRPGDPASPGAAARPEAASARAGRSRAARPRERSRAARARRRVDPSLERGGGVPRSRAARRDAARAAARGPRRSGAAHRRDEQQRTRRSSCRWPSSRTPSRSSVRASCSARKAALLHIGKPDDARSRTPDAWAHARSRAPQVARRRGSLCASDEAALKGSAAYLARNVAARAARRGRETHAARPGPPRQARWDGAGRSAMQRAHGSARTLVERFLDEIDRLDVNVRFGSCRHRGRPRSAALGAAVDGRAGARAAHRGRGAAARVLSSARRRARRAPHDGRARRGHRAAPQGARRQPRGHAGAGRLSRRQDARAPRADRVTAAHGRAARRRRGSGWRTRGRGQGARRRSIPRRRRSRRGPKRRRAPHSFPG